MSSNEKQLKHSVTNVLSKLALISHAGQHSRQMPFKFVSTWNEFLKNRKESLKTCLLWGQLPKQLVQSSLTKTCPCVCRRSLFVLTGIHLHQFVHASKIWFFLFDLCQWVCFSFSYANKTFALKVVFQFESTLQHCPVHSEKACIIKNSCRGIL